jgi:hypothetical protein
MSTQLSGIWNNQERTRLASDQLKLVVKTEHNYTEPIGPAEGAMMTIPAKLPPTRWSPVTISSDEDCERLDRALEELEKEDQWINSFIKRLNCTIEEIGHKN